MSLDKICCSKKVLKQLRNHLVLSKLLKFLRVLFSPANFYRAMLEKESYAKEILYLREQLSFARTIYDQAIDHHKPIKVLLIINETGIFSCFKDIYNQMKVDPEFEVTVIAVPIYDEDSKPNMFVYERLLAILADEGVQFVEGISGDHRTPIDLFLLSPGYVFYLDPYMYSYCKHYRPDFVSLFARVCYIPYGYMMLANLNNASETGYYNRYFHNLCWRIFCESSWHLEQFKKYQKNHGKNVLYLGYPKNDIRTNVVVSDYWEKIRQKFKKIIVWCPHWTISNVYSHCKTGNFNFYCQDMLTMASRLSDVFFVLKPHPNLKQGAVGSGFMTDSELDNYIKAWNSNSNTTCYEGNDYQQLWFMCDALIFDSVSFVAEFLKYGKPGLFLERKDRTEFNEFGNKMLEHYEKAWNFSDIELFVRKVTSVNGENSCNFVRELNRDLLDDNGSAAKNICNYLKQQWHNEKS